MTRPHLEFKDDHIPIAYLITFRGYGTWLHGDSSSYTTSYGTASGSDRMLALKLELLALLKGFWINVG